MAEHVFIFIEGVSSRASLNEAVRWGINFSQQFAAIVLAAIIGGLIIRKLYKPKVKIRFDRRADLTDDHGTFFSINVTNIGHNCARKCVSYIRLDDACIKDIHVMKSEKASDHEELPSYSDEGSQPLPHQLCSPLSLYQQCTESSEPKANHRKQLVDDHKVRSLRYIFLCWTCQGNPSEIDLQPGMTRSIDICRWQKKNSEKESVPYWIFPSEQGWRKLQARVYANNTTLTGQLFICQADHEPLVADIKLECIQYPTVDISVK